MQFSPLLKETSQWNRLRPFTQTTTDQNSDLKSRVSTNTSTIQLLHLGLRDHCSEIRSLTGLALLMHVCVSWLPKCAFTVSNYLGYWILKRIWDVVSFQHYFDKPLTIQTSIWLG